MPSPTSFGSSRRRFMASLDAKAGATTASSSWRRTHRHRARRASRHRRGDQRAASHSGKNAFSRSLRRLARDAFSTMSSSAEATPRASPRFGWECCRRRDRLRDARAARTIPAGRLVGTRVLATTASAPALPYVTRPQVTGRRGASSLGANPGDERSRPRVGARGLAPRGRRRASERRLRRDRRDERSYTDL